MLCTRWRAPCSSIIRCPSSRSIYDSSAAGFFNKVKTLFVTRSHRIYLLSKFTSYLLPGLDSDYRSSPPTRLCSYYEKFVLRCLTRSSKGGKYRSDMHSSMPIIIGTQVDIDLHPQTRGDLLFSRCQLRRWGRGQSPFVARVAMSPSN